MPPNAFPRVRDHVCPPTGFSYGMQSHDTLRIQTTPQLNNFQVLQFACTPGLIFIYLYREASIATGRLLPRQKRNHCLYHCSRGLLSMYIGLEFPYQVGIRKSISSRCDIGDYLSVIRSLTGSAQLEVVIFHPCRLSIKRRPWWRVRQWGVGDRGEMGYMWKV